MKASSTVCASLSFLLFAGGASFLRAELSPEAFRTPPLQARPSCLWLWINGYVDRQEITRELEEMKAKGMRGGIIWDMGALSDPNHLIPTGPELLGTESLKSIHHAMDEAQRLGLEIGFAPSSSWNAGGKWIEPKDASKEILWSELKLQGPSEFAGDLPLPGKASKFYQNIAVLAVPDSADAVVEDVKSMIRLDCHLSENGRLTWSVPAGNWRVLRFICNNTGQPLMCPSPNSSGLMVDHLSSDAADAHFNHVLETLSQGRKDFGALKLLMLDSYEVKWANDWTPSLADYFNCAYGYDPDPWLPVLAGWTVGSREMSERFRNDYQKAVSDLIISGHFVRAREILHAKGLQLLAEGGHGGHARVDPLKALGAADIPMGEFWNNRKNWVTKEAASASHIYGKQLINCESFTGWQNWQDGPAGYKRLLDIALCAGLNQVTFHTFTHNPPSMGLPGVAYHAGEHFNVNSTWWNQAGPMVEDMSRACHLLQQGRFVADVCVYYGDEAPNLVPARRLPPNVAHQWTEDKCQHCGKPLPVDLKSLGYGYDYDYVNEEVILSRMSVEDGRIVLPGGMSYRVLVLPDRKGISLPVLRKIGELVQAGATVVGPKPERSNSLMGYPDCDREVKDLAAMIWHDCDGVAVTSHEYGKGRVIWNVPLNQVLEGMGVTPDFLPEAIDNSDRHMDFIHRSTGDEEIYFVSNSSDENQSVRCRFRVGDGWVPSFWNAEDGSVRACHEYEVGDGFTTIPLRLAPASSIFVVFAKGDPSDHLVSSGGPVALDVIGMKSDSLESWVSAAGEYDVRAASGRSSRWVVDAVPAPQAINGPWSVEFEKGRGAPDMITMNPLVDWSTHPDEGVKYFSGMATYRNTFDIDESRLDDGVRVTLDLGIVREVAELRINGKPVGLKWKKPYSADVTSLLRPGRNDLEVRVVNTWNNRLVGDSMLDPAKRITRTNLAYQFKPDSPLLSSGLIGPVLLKYAVKSRVSLK